MKEKLKKVYLEYSLFLILGFAFLSMFTFVFKELKANNYIGIAYRGVVLGLAIIILIVGFILFKKIPPKKILIPIGIYIVANITAIIVAPLIMIPGSIISWTTYLMAISLVFANALSVIVFLIMGKGQYYKEKHIDVICLIMMAFGVFLAIFSYIAQWESIYYSFTKEAGWNYDVTSIFYTKTIYGFSLLVCSLFTIIYIFRKRQYWWYLLVIFFLGNCFISRSKTPLFFISILLIVLLVYHLLDSFKRHKKAWIISLSVVAVIILVLCLFTFVPSLRKGPFESIYKFLTDTIINDGKVVMQDRFNKWGFVFTHMNNPFVVIFGCGEKFASYILVNSDHKVMVGDSVYVTNYATGGIIKFVLYLVLVLYVLVKTYRSSLTKEGKFISLSFSMLILLAGIIEDDNLVGFGYIPLLLMPLFYMNKNMIEKKENE